MQKVRVCELEPGDHFERLGVSYRVVNVTESEVIFTYVKDCGSAVGPVSSIGRKSKQFVNKKIA